MEIKIKWPYIKATFDTDNAELIDLPACPEKHEKDAVISMWKGPNHMNYAIAKIHTGTIESSNALAKEICRRWNAFRKDGLQETDNIMASELARKLNAAVLAYDNIDVRAFTDEELKNYADLCNNGLIEANRELYKRGL